MKTVEDFASHIRSLHFEAIDDELNLLLEVGIPFNAIAIEHHPGPRTVITAYGKRIAEFTVSLKTI